jgi:hypothetical protein
MQKRRAGFHQFVRAYNYTPYQKLIPFNITIIPRITNIYNYRALKV